MPPALLSKPSGGIGNAIRLGSRGNTNECSRRHGTLHCPARGSRRRRGVRQGSGCRERRAQDAGAGGDRPRTDRSGVAQRPRRRVRPCGRAAQRSARTRHRDRTGQERPYRSQDRRHLRLHRHAFVLRASERGRTRRPRHDHVGRLHPGPVVVRRDGGTRQYHHVLAPLHGADDLDHVARGFRARQTVRRGAQAATRQGGVPTGPGANDVDEHAARHGRLPGGGAAGGKELQRQRLQGVPSGRVARRQPALRLRPDAQGRAAAAGARERADAFGTGDHDGEELRLPRHRGRGRAKTCCARLRAR